MAVVFKIHFVETGGFGAKILAFDRARLGNVDVAIADPMALECLVRPFRNDRSAGNFLVRKSNDPMTLDSDFIDSKFNLVSGV